MARTVGGSDVGKAIVDALREYTDDVSDAIRQEVDDTASDIKREVVARSPVGRRGKYRRGWKITKRDSKGVTTRIVHNSGQPGLVHLLEHGHAKRGGGRVPAKPHVAPAAEPRIREMEDNIKRIVENGGG